jgi:hypothetical protein
MDVIQPQHVEHCQLQDAGTGTVETAVNGNRKLENRRFCLSTSADFIRGWMNETESKPLS